MRRDPLVAVVNSLAARVRIMEKAMERMAAKGDEGDVGEEGHEGCHEKDDGGDVGEEGHEGCHEEEDEGDAGEEGHEGCHEGGDEGDAGEEGHEGCHEEDDEGDAGEEGHEGCHEEGDAGEEGHEGCHEEDDEGDAGEEGHEGCHEEGDAGDAGLMIGDIVFTKCRLDSPGPFRVYRIGWGSYEHEVRVHCLGEDANVFSSGHWRFKSSLLKLEVFDGLVVYREGLVEALEGKRKIPKGTECRFWGFDEDGDVKLMNADGDMTIIFASGLVYLDMLL